MVSLVNMERNTCYFAALFFFVAFILLILAVISLPSMPGMDITRVNAGNGTSLIAANESITQMRFGIWAYCYDLVNGTLHCGASAVSIKGYSVTISNGTDTVDIVAPWTRGLTLHVIAAAMTFFALSLCIFKRISVVLVACSVTAFLSTTASFVVDAILYVYIKSQMTDLGFGGNTKPSYAFWITLASVLLLVVGGSPLWLGGCWRSLANQKVLLQLPREKLLNDGGKMPWFY